MFIFIAIADISTVRSLIHLSRLMEVLYVDYQKLQGMRLGETSSEVRLRVEAARQIQRNRFSGTTLASNADLAGSEAIILTHHAKARQ